MKSSAPQFGCQTYTWQMSLEKYGGELEHIISTIGASGMTGIEPEVCMLGKFATSPDRLQACLQKHGVTLGALCLVCDWLEAEESPAERALADSTIAMLKDYFPGSVLVLCQMPGTDRQNLRERQKNALACISSVGERAHAAGLVSAFHPNSPDGSLFRTKEDYAIMLEGLAPTPVGFAPDAGHIAKGGMDPLKVVRETLGMIRHVHFKDMDASGRWMEMGGGCVDFRGIVDLLQEAGYEGWIMIEDESARAEQEPDSVTFANGKYVRENFIGKQG
jgi:inosose dehydratase